MNHIRTLKDIVDDLLRQEYDRVFGMSCQPEQGMLCSTPFEYNNSNWLVDLKQFNKTILQSDRTWASVKKEFQKQAISVRLNNKCIATLDNSLSNLAALEELSLSGNLLQNVVCLPKTLKILHLNANKFKSLTRFYEIPLLTDLSALIHIGFAYNHIGCMSELHFPETLISLDLSWNNIIDFDVTITCLSKLPNIRSLALIGNPICLLPAYQSECIKRMPNLLNLDDICTKNVLINTKFSSNNIVIQANSIKVKNLPDPSLGIQDKYAYTVSFESPNFDNMISSAELSISSMILQSDQAFTFNFPPSTSIRDSLVSGFKMTLIRKCYRLTNREELSKETVNTKIKNAAKPKKVEPS